MNINFYLLVFGLAYEDVIHETLTGGLRLY